MSWVTIQRSIRSNCINLSAVGEKNPSLLPQLPKLLHLQIYAHFLKPQTMSAYRDLLSPRASRLNFEWFFPNSPRLSMRIIFSITSSVSKYGIKAKLGDPLRYRPETAIPSSDSSPNSIAELLGCAQPYVRWIQRCCFPYFCISFFFLLCIPALKGPIKFRRQARLSNYRRISVRLAGNEKTCLLRTISAWEPWNCIYRGPRNPRFTA